MVDDDDARYLVREFYEITGSGTDLAIDLLERNFRPERIRYFVTSAIGFYKNPRSETYDPHDPQNLLPEPEVPGKMRIRGSIHPHQRGRAAAVAIPAAYEPPTVEQAMSHPRTLARNWPARGMTDEDQVAEPTDRLHPMMPGRETR